jgi:hypothetical protein
MLLWLFGSLVALHILRLQNISAQPPMW